MENKIQNLKSKIQNRLPWLVLLLVIMGQCYYLPERLDFLRQTLSFAQITEPREIARLAYGAADYDLLAWVAQETPPETTLLLLTASPHTYGDPSYVLYHRAIYHLYPRSVWWAAPVPPVRYPAWWIESNLSEGDILEIAQQHQATAILADGFSHSPVTGASLAFDKDTFLIFPGSREIQSTVKEQTQQKIETTTTSGQFYAALQKIRLYLQTLLAVGAVWLWGDALYVLTIRPFLPPSLPRRLATGWLLGCGLTSLSTFTLLWAGLSLATAVIILSGSGCLFWFFIRRKNKPPISPALPSTGSGRGLRSPAFAFRRVLASSPHRLLFILIIALQIGLVALAAWANPLTDWDTWVNWAGKANAVFIDQSLSANLYHNPARLPTNMDYPLMLPLVEAWFYTWLGQTHEPVIGLISFLFYVALLLLFYDAARRIVSPAAAAGFTALFATIPRLERPAHSGLADIPLAALVFLSFLLLAELFKNLSSEIQSPLPVILSLSKGRPPAPLLSSPLLPLATTAGLLPWLKNEGWLWWALLSLSLLAGLALQVKRKRLSIGQTLIFWLSYLIPALIIPLLWQVFLTLYGTYRFTFLPLTLANFWANLPRLTPISWNMLIRLLNPYWNFVWLLAGLTLLSRRERILFAPLGWLVLPIAGYLVLISLAYVFSRFDPFLAQLNNSAERLILQAVPLILWWLLDQSVAIGWIKGKPEELRELKGIEGIEGVL